MNTYSIYFKTGNVVQFDGIDYFTDEHNVLRVIDVEMSTVFMAEWSNISYVLIDTEDSVKDDLFSSNTEGDVIDN